jgi:hypothetical protein
MQTLRVAVVLLSVAVAMLAYALWGRSGRERRAVLPTTAPVIPVSRLTEADPVKEIDLEYHSPDLPPGPGQDIFATQCVICHSARYSSTSPPFHGRSGRLRSTRWSRATEHPSIRNRETWGRLRYNHTQGIFFGWLGNALIAFCYFVVPRLTNRPVTSRTLGSSSCMGAGRARVT